MELLTCTLKLLPSHKVIDAARTAIKINPANAPAQPLGLGEALVLPPGHIALLTSKYWGAKGVHLTVSFLDNPDQATRTKILLHMNAWAKTANVQFVETAMNGQVRIARGSGGYYSYLGTDILHIPFGQQTMNLQGFTASGTPDSEFYRVVRHETGHVLGFPHEHQRREEVARIDPSKAIPYFERTQGWSEQEVRDQVLTPLDEASIMGTPPDQTSIMCYQLPGSICFDGLPILGGTDIDVSDAAFAAKLYPSAVTPPPPPPVGTWLTLTADLAAGRYLVTPAGG